MFISRNFSFKLILIIISDSIFYIFRWSTLNQQNRFQEIGNLSMRRSWKSWESSTIIIIEELCPSLAVILFRSPRRMKKKSLKQVQVDPSKEEGSLLIWCVKRQMVFVICSLWRMKAIFSSAEKETRTLWLTEHKSTSHPTGREIHLLMRIPKSHKRSGLGKWFTFWMEKWSTTNKRTEGTNWST